MPLTDLPHIEREPLWDRVYTELRDALLGGKFSPGEKITIRSIAGAMGISPTPVRDALTRLIAERVLDQGPQGSAIVPAITADTFRQIVAVRSSLEGMAAAEAAKAATAEDTAEGKRRLELLVQLIDRGEFDTYLDRHREFHFHIYRTARMPVLMETIENLWLRSGPVLNLVVPDYVLRRRGSDFHRSALEAIEAHDPKGARSAIVADIEAAGQYILSLVDDAGVIRRPEAAPA